jgi:hypothetical protein
MSTSQTRDGRSALDTPAEDTISITDERVASRASSHNTDSIREREHIAIGTLAQQHERWLALWYNLDEVRALAPHLARAVDQESAALVNAAKAFIDERGGLAEMEVAVRRADDVCARAHAWLRGVQ